MLLQFDDAAEIAAWTLTGHASIGPSFPAVSAPNTLFLSGKTGTIIPPSPGFSSQADYPLAGMQVGIPMTVRLWTNGDLFVSSPLVVTLSDSTQTVTFTLSSPIGSGWQLWEPGNFNPGATTGTLSLFVGATSTAAAIWLADDIDISSVGVEVATGKWDAISNALTMLRGINGTSGGYFTNFEGRVYTRLITPEEFPGGAKMPFACLPLSNEAESLAYEDRLSNAEWTMTVFAYFDEEGYNDPLNSPALEYSAKFRDDLVRLFMGDQTLLGQTTNCEVRSINTVAGIARDYALVEGTITFFQAFGRQNLGPAGI